MGVRSDSGARVFPLWLAGDANFADRAEGRGWHYDFFVGAGREIEFLERCAGRNGRAVRRSRSLIALRIFYSLLRK